MRALRHRLPLLSLAVLASPLALLVSTAQPATATPAAGVHAINPFRALDTRDGTGTTPAPFDASERRTLTIAGVGGVPAGATAVALNVTVTAPSAAGFVTVWPSGGAQPKTSNLNFVAGQTVANMVTVGLGQGGAVDLFSIAQTQLIVDVAGWYGATDGFVAIQPDRLLDTRDKAAPFAAGEQRLVSVSSRVPVSATAVALNVTATDTTAASYLTVWPSGAARPDASNVNMVVGQTVANMVTTGLGADGSIAIFNANGAVDVIVDIAGYYTSGFHALTPSRIMDTRSNVCGLRMGPGETRLVAVTGHGGVPAGAGAVALNVTMLNPSESSYLTLWPSGGAVPTTSNLNAAAGTVPNMVTVGVGADGKVAIFNAVGTTDVLIDVAGWFDSTGGSALASSGCSTVGGAPAGPLRNEGAAVAADPLAPAAPGSSSPNVSNIQFRLLQLGFWVPDTDGYYGQATAQAVMAFQKWMRLPATSVVDQYSAFLMTMLSLRPIAQSTTGDLLEVDKGRQLIFFVRNGKPILTVNTSTGSDIPYTEVDQKNGGTVTGDAHTPEGRFHVYREVPDGWEHGQLGDLYRPRYFNGGVALHGAPNIPNYPASHGCVRVSTAFMDYVWATDLLPHGSEVWVHS